MQVKEFEGVEYIEKTQVDELIRSRLAKMSERARTAEGQIEDLKTQVEKSAGSAGQLEAMATQLEALQAELKQSHAKYQTHATITASGFTDPNIRDMIEWSYSRTMQSRSKKDRCGLGEWLETIKSDPSVAPSELRPFVEPATSAAVNGTPAVVAPTTTTTTAPPPSGGAVVAPPDMSGRDLMDEALRDPAIWAAKNEEIKASWYNQRGKPGPFKF